MTATTYKFNKIDGKAFTRPVKVKDTSLAPYADFDASFRAFLLEWNIPGATLAVAKEGRLVLVRGYGEASPGRPTHASDRGRIASLSKAVTAAAILTMVEDGVLDLDESAYALLPQSRQGAADADSPLSEITIRHLLHHQGDGIKLLQETRCLRRSPLQSKWTPSRPPP